MFLRSQLLLILLWVSQVQAQSMSSNPFNGTLNGVPGSALTPLQIQVVVYASMQVKVTEYDNPLASLESGSSTRIAVVITDSRLPYRVIHPEGNSGRPCPTGQYSMLMRSQQVVVAESTTGQHQQGLLKDSYQNEHSCLQSVIRGNQQVLLLMMTTL